MKVSLMIVILFLAGCETIPNKVRPTNEELSVISSTCTSMMDNHLLAKKKCFPLIHETKKLTVVVERISNTYGLLSISAEAGHNSIFCYPNKAHVEKLQADTSLLEVGDIIDVWGKFDNFSQPFHIFTINDCSFAVVEKVPKPS